MGFFYKYFNDFLSISLLTMKISYLWVSLMKSIMEILNCCNLKLKCTYYLIMYSKEIWLTAKKNKSENLNSVNKKKKL